ncbi:MAG: prolyl oligopeptidase family serine peptidase, partial [Bacteroidales bacterium]|nr:prolyl oligopeptidase family serine peptidase [Bacteroidales bacterium]
MNRRTLHLLLITIMTFTTAMAQTQFSKEQFVSQKGDSLLYRELQPQIIDADTKYPLVLFLHGAGERGNDNEAQLQHGANMFTNPVNQEKYPTFALFPQCPVDSYWAPVNRSGTKDESFFPYTASTPPILQAVKELLDEFINNNPIDTDRIYIMGLSMGGMGTFEMVCRYPNLFAAAIPICGGVNTKRLEEIETSTSFRIFHGDADAVVPVTFSRDAYTTLKAKNVNVEYIEFPGIDHDSWTPAFNMPDFMEWTFSQS